MSSPGAYKDLIALVADADTAQGIQGILERRQSLGIRAVTYDVAKHPERDPGCRLRAHDFLRPLTGRYRFALVLFDREGSGQPDSGRTELESEVETRLRGAGWGDRAAVIVIDPELEAWVWSDSPHVDRLLGWRGGAGLRCWLRERGYLGANDVKPSHPKEAVEAALQEVRKGRSPALYLQLAQSVGLERCLDRSFLKLKETLVRWFPQTPT